MEQARQRRIRGCRRRSDSMNELKRLMDELIHELYKMDIEELYELKKVWAMELKESRLDERLQDFCIKAVDLVIEKKESNCKSME